MSPQDQPNAFPKGPEFQKFFVQICWAGLKVDTELDVGIPEFESVELFLFYLKFLVILKHI